MSYAWRRDRDFENIWWFAGRPSTRNPVLRLEQEFRRLGRWRACYIDPDNESAMDGARTSWMSSPASALFHLSLSAKHSDCLVDAQFARDAVAALPEDLR